MTISYAACTARSVLTHGMRSFVSPELRRARETPESTPRVPNSEADAAHTILWLCGTLNFVPAYMCAILVLTMPYLDIVLCAWLVSGRQKIRMNG